ncbi:hypothetical protein MKW98_030786, partial [Papaver atlanticum]
HHKSPYRELDIKSSISQQLANTFVVEYPAIYVYFPSSSDDVWEEEDPQILDPMKCVNAESVSASADEFFFSNIEDLELPENSGFNFQQDLRDAYSGLIGEINPDDFLDLDGEFLQGFSDEELEEGEIPE